MAIHEKIPAERIKAIRALIEAERSAGIKELSERFNVSEATIRRDLDELAREGFLERTFGGAVALSQQTETEKEYREKTRMEPAAKAEIAQVAASFVKEGMTVLLDSGTTAYQIALCLSTQKNITIITNDLYLAANIEFDPSITVVVAGGIKRFGQNVCIGNLAEDFLKQFIRADITFLMADAVDAEDGVTNSGLFEVGVKRSMIHAGRKIILCADHTKLGRELTVKVCDIDCVDMLITDGQADKKILKKFEKLGIEVFAKGFNN